MKKLGIQLLMLLVLLFSCKDDEDTKEDIRLKAVGVYAGTPLHYTYISNPNQFIPVNFGWEEIDLYVSASTSTKDELIFKDKNGNLIFKGSNVKDSGKALIFDLDDYTASDINNKPVLIDGKQGGYFIDTKKMQLNFEYSYSGYKYYAIYTLLKK